MRARLKQVAGRLGILPLYRLAHRRVTKMRMRLRRRLRATGLRQPEVRSLWDAGLEAELDFWRRELPTRVAFSPDYRGRASHDSKIVDPVLVELLNDLPQDEVSIIDVGSGPLTSVGQTFPGKKVHVTAADPLGDAYQELLRKIGISAPSPPVGCAGEDLLDCFEPGTFDVAHARNALDHSYDPLRVIDNMLSLVHPGGVVLLQHLRNEAWEEYYSDLHQWNFDLSGEDLIVWQRRTQPLNISAAVSDRAQVSCRLHGRWLIARLQRSSSAGG